MKTIHVAGLLAATTLFAACSGGGGGNGVSVDSNGNCTEQFISDYNDIVRANLKITSYSSRSDQISQLRDLDSACDKFFSVHSTNISCMAEVNYQKTSLSTPKVKEVCDSVKAKLRTIDNRAPVTPAPVTPAPITPTPVTHPETPAPPVSHDTTISNSKADGQTSLNSLTADQIVLKIVDPSALTDLLAIENTYIQHGTVSYIDKFSPTVPLCYFTKVPNIGGNDSFSKGTNLVFMVKDEKPRNTDEYSLIAAFTGKNFGMACLKFSATPFTVRDLRDALSPAFEVTIRK